MFIASAFGASGAIWLTVGMWLIRRQRRRHAGTLAGWGALAFGVAQLIRAAGSLAGDRQPLGVILALGFTALSVAGWLLVIRDGATPRFRIGRTTRKRRKLPPIR
ncbi:hypothetical protein [Streptomyces fuscichromogenes]|uniref:Uncharacterized protein n=1 Tax=Streptomyces fuscichromogenes TaxID=1324013 RepID=A0A917XIJ9_9ACTN|nr:hypothetical protein [Streptomyces fuscichromogenes]GGN26063.1 hypothetical protein GCM10011578_060390 [Streptomyces fuscichromogenes]